MVSHGEALANGCQHESSAISKSPTTCHYLFESIEEVLNYVTY